MLILLHNHKLCLHNICDKGNNCAAINDRCSSICVWAANMRMPQNNKISQYHHFLHDWKSTKRSARAHNRQMADELGSCNKIDRDEALEQNAISFGRAHYAQPPNTQMSRISNQIDVCVHRIQVIIVRNIWAARHRRNPSKAFSSNCLMVESIENIALLVSRFSCERRVN